MISKFVSSRTIYVRFGSQADICSATGHVRFTPNSDRKSGHVQMVMSALPPKADVCGANRHVCFGPEPEIPVVSTYRADPTREVFYKRTPGWPVFSRVIPRARKTSRGG